MVTKGGFGDNLKLVLVQEAEVDGYNYNNVDTY